jgi:hypothetical protein
MTDKIYAGTILIEESALLPESLRLETASYTKGWRLVKDLDGGALDRMVRDAGWTFFYMADEVKASALCFDREAGLRSAVGKIIASMRPDRFNSLEITQVVSNTFLRLPYVTVSVHPRHIQESMELCRAKRIAEWGRSALAAAPTQA